MSFFTALFNHLLRRETRAELPRFSFSRNTRAPPTPWSTLAHPSPPTLFCFFHARRRETHSILFHHVATACRSREDARVHFLAIKFAEDAPSLARARRRKGFIDPSRPQDYFAKIYWPAGESCWTLSDVRQLRPWPFFEFFCSHRYEDEVSFSILPRQRRYIGYWGSILCRTRLRVLVLHFGISCL